MINYVHAEKKDLIYIKKFIANNYKNNHILIKNRNLFNFYFLDKNKNKPQFLLAKDSKKQIIAIIGYITNHQFDSKIKIKSLWLALWIAKKQYSNMIGIVLLKKIESLLKPNFIASLGVGKQVLPIYKRFGYLVGNVDHFIKKIVLTKKIINNRYIIKKGLPLKFKNKNKNKTLNYLTNKYNNNFYNYHFYHIMKDKAVMAVLVGRLILYKKKYIFRIVDIIGNINSIQFFGSKILKVDNKKIHYIDFFYKNTELKKINIKGFFKSKKNNYLPLYFEPLIDKFQNKYCVYKFITKSSSIEILTGDGDQDRPNKIL